MTRKYLMSAALFVSGLLAAVFCPGCGASHGELFPSQERELVWPEPPEEPRIRYVGSISTEVDLKRGVSWSQGLGELVFGRKETGVLLNPYGLIVDDTERLLVCDTAGASVHIFDLRTRQYNQFSAVGAGGNLVMPVSVAAVGQNIYVADSVLQSICVFGREGRFEFSFGAERLKRPCGIAYSRKHDRIFVSDTLGHEVHVFDRTGQYERSIGARGSVPGLFNFPTHIFVDNSGRLFVSDTLNYRVQVFSDTGEFSGTFGRHGDRPGCFGHPSGIATDSYGHIYVTDRQFENVQVFDSDGRILLAFGAEGVEPGEFWLPAGVFTDGSNRIYVADSFNKRIQVFALIGAEADDNEN